MNFSWCKRIDSIEFPIIKMKIECCICCEKIDNGHCEVVSTVCGHIFHSNCMNQWLGVAATSTCPQCRRRVSSADLRKIYLNTVSSRNSDIFNSSIVMNLRDVQEDLCIMQTNLERENEQLKMENKRLVTENASLKKEKQRLASENERQNIEKCVLASAPIRKTMKKTRSVRYDINSSSSEE